MYRSRPLVAAAVLAIGLSAGCKTTQPFTWKDALASSHEEAQQTLGEFEKCERNWAARPGPVPGMPSPGASWTFCLVSDDAEQPNSKYKVRAIAYVEERVGESKKLMPAAVYLEPRAKTVISGELIDDWNLPRLAIVHQRPPTGEQHFRPHLAYRAVEPTDERGAPRAIDVFPTKQDGESSWRFDDYDVVGSVRIYGQDRTNTIAFVVQEGGPPPATPELVLPALRSSLPIDDSSNLYAEVGLDTVRLGERSIYPLPPADLASAHPDQETLPRAELSGAAAWQEALEAASARKQRQAELLNQRHDPSLVIAAERTLRASELMRLLDGATASELSKFQLVGRDIAGTDDSYGPQRGAIRRINFTYLSAEHDARVPDEVRPSDLKITIEPDGFAVSIGGEELPSVDGCPSDGPTICRIDAELDVSEVVQEAQRLQRDDRLVESQVQIRAMLDTYDWAQLYGTLAAIKEEHPEQTVVRIEVADTEATVAHVARVMGTSSVMRRSSGAEAGDCTTTFADNAALSAAVACEEGEDAYDVRELFNDPVLVAGEAAPSAPGEEMR